MGFNSSCNNADHHKVGHHDECMMTPTMISTIVWGNIPGSLFLVLEMNQSMVVEWGKLFCGHGTVIIHWGCPGFYCFYWLNVHVNHKTCYQCEGMVMV
jgi:hypothetical protein